VSNSPHPLDPLSADEIRRVTALVRATRPGIERWRFGSIELIEPAKDQLPAPSSLDPEVPEEPPARLARAVVWDREGDGVDEVTVDLQRAAILDTCHRPGVQANFTAAEYRECDAYLRGHPEVVAALARRGIHELELVLFDLWAYGGVFVPEGYGDRRVGWCDVWLRATPDGNPYAHFVGGLRPIVDVNRVALIELQDVHDPGRPAVMGEYRPQLVPGQTLRSDLRPYEVTQPQGPSFTLEGNELAWQRWRMRVGFNHREGLVLHQVGYEDPGPPARRRSVAHRLSFTEMVVPYRDPSSEHSARTAFDIGEWGLGYMTESLQLGCDCLGEIRYLDATLADAAGEPYTIARAICIHEEDAGPLWKHVDERAGAEVRRMRRLVVSFHATVANYEYLIYWRFHQDGSIECEVRATGIMVTTTLAPDDPPPRHGTLVDERTYAPFHQHFIVARLDLDIDGEANTVMEVDSLALAIDEANPRGLALVQRSTPIRSEAESGRDYDWSTQRSWKVVNPNRMNAHGDPVAYKLVPGAALPAMFDPASPMLTRAPVIAHPLWVTRHAEAERWPAGEYPVQSHGEDGILAWTARDGSLEEADVVLWYVFGIHHITRPEDWPVMPVDTVSFWLKPFGFFDRNPALDVAPEPGHCG
jgi:primary-amine oxidase